MILVGHGSRHSSAAGEPLPRLAAAVQRAGGYAPVRTATLLGPGPRPADAIADLGGRPVRVVPVTMCDGQTARTDIPAAFADRPSGLAPPWLTFCPPVGTHPALAALIARRARAAAGAGAAAATSLLLIGHGSQRLAASATATCLQAARLATRGGFREVSVAFLEQAPRLAEVLTVLPGPIIAVGLFATAGRHATLDVDHALAAADRGDVRYLGPIGGDPALARVVLAILAATGDAVAADIVTALPPPVAHAAGPTEGRLP